MAKIPFNLCNIYIIPYIFLKRYSFLKIFNFLIILTQCYLRHGKNLGVSILRLLDYNNSKTTPRAYRTVSNIVERITPMEHILISPGKLKLMLTKSDLDRYDLDCEAMDSEDTLTRQAFRELLADVKRVSGFDAADDKVFIQLYPSRDGGAEIYITRLTLGKEQNSRKNDTIKLTSVYRFDSMESLLEICSYINSQNVTCGKRHPLPNESSAWQSDGKYYLICEESVTYREYLRSGKNDRFGEYIGSLGKRLQSSVALPYVKEHCTCFCEHDAISALAKLA